jgi:NADH-quinone oxidoreductase subunit A
MPLTLPGPDLYSPQQQLRKTSTSGSGFFLAYFVKKITKSQGEGCPMPDLEPRFELGTYYPIFVYLAFIVAFVVVSLSAAHLIGPRRNTPIKLMPYESGMDPIGDARQRFDVKFYLIAILFLVFDVELLFLYPWAVVAYQEGGLPSGIGRVVFWEMLIFLATLVVAYVYAWRRGVFKWR